MLNFFCWKNVSAKATHIFSAKHIRILYTESAKTVNEMTLNELVMLTTLWTTGPRFIIRLNHYLALAWTGPILFLLHYIFRILNAYACKRRPRLACAFKTIYVTVRMLYSVLKRFYAFPIFISHFNKTPDIIYNIAWSAFVLSVINCTSISQSRYICKLGDVSNLKITVFCVCSSIIILLINYFQETE